MTPWSCETTPVRGCLHAWTSQSSMPHRWICVGIEDYSQNSGSFQVCSSFFTFPVLEASHWARDRWCPETSPGSPEQTRSLGTIRDSQPFRPSGIRESLSKPQFPGFIFDWPSVCCLPQKRSQPQAGCRNRWPGLPPESALILVMPLDVGFFQVKSGLSNNEAASPRGLFFPVQLRPEGLGWRASRVLSSVETPQVPAAQSVVVFPE